MKGIVIIMFLALHLGAKYGQVIPAGITEKRSLVKNFHIPFAHEAEKLQLLNHRNGSRIDNTPGILPWNTTREKKRIQRE